MLPLSAWFQVAGAVQLAIGLTNLPLARRLEYRKNLAGASAIVRQIFYVHAVYVVLVVLGFAALSLLFPAALSSGRPLGRILIAFLAVFWLLRVPIQLLYYPIEVRRQNRLADVADHLEMPFARPEQLGPGALIQPDKGAEVGMATWVLSGRAPRRQPRFRPVCSAP